MSLIHAYKGLYDNGRFYPEDQIDLTGCFQAILVIEKPVNDKTEKKTVVNETPIKKWEQIMQMIEEASDEPMPEFPRMDFGRDLIDL